MHTFTLSANKTTLGKLIFKASKVMNESQANKVISILENGLLSEFTSYVSVELGYEIAFRVSKRYYNWTGYIVDLREEGDFTTKNLISSPLTRLMFKDAEVYADLYYSEENQMIGLTVKISYHHPDGGSNGKDLFRLGYSIEEGKFIKY